MNTDGTPPGPETTRRHPRAARPHPPQGPAGTGTPDPARVTVEDGHLGAPFSLLRTDQAISWKVHLRAEHILRGTCPVPPGLADRVPDTPLNVALVPVGALGLAPGAKRVPILDYRPGAVLGRDGGAPLLTGMSWHRFVLPGTRVAVRWDRRAKTRLHLAYTPLPRPVVVAGTTVRYAYDPRIMTRDLAAAGIRADRTEALLLITLRELGYLDEDGRALLPWPALVRGTAERASLADRAGAGEASPPRIEDAIRRLLARGLLTREWGSLNPSGLLSHPARAGETRVELLCHTPTVQEAEPAEPATASAHTPGAPSAHRVAGHLMRIGHLGKEAGPEARAAYREDHRRAGLAGPHELPHGYTYVREHERGT